MTDRTKGGGASTRLRPSSWLPSPLLEAVQRAVDLRVSLHDPHVVSRLGVRDILREKIRIVRSRSTDPPRDTRAAGVVRRERARRRDTPGETRREMRGAELQAHVGIE